jgi:drug/metabolite transporter (DMT)-like permease
VSWTAVALALAAAACFAAMSALQHYAASREDRLPALDPRLVARLLHRPLWLAGTACQVIAVALQALALSFGTLTLVEPLLTAGLFLAVPMSAALDRRRPHRQDLAAVALAALGLAAFLLAAEPRGGVAAPSAQAWAPSGFAIAVLVVGALASGRRLGVIGRATSLGLANGLINGTNAGLLKASTDLLAHHPLELVTSWPLYPLLALAAVAFMLSQSAIQDALTAPLIAITLADPIVGLVLGLLVFHDHLATDGPRLLVLALAGVAMAVGVVLAVTSPYRSARSPSPGDAPTPPAALTARATDDGPARVEQGG